MLCLNFCKVKNLNRVNSLLKDSKVTNIQDATASSMVYSSLHERVVLATGSRSKGEGEIAGEQAKTSNLKSRLLNLATLSRLMVVTVHDLTTLFVIRAHRLLFYCMLKPLECLKDV